MFASMRCACACACVWMCCACVLPLEKQYVVFHVCVVALPELSPPPLQPPTHTSLPLIMVRTRRMRTVPCHGVVSYRLGSCFRVVRLVSCHVMSYRIISCRVVVWCHIVSWHAALGRAAVVISYRYRISASMSHISTGWASRLFVITHRHVMSCHARAHVMSCPYHAPGSVMYIMSCDVM